MTLPDCLDGIFLVFLEIVSRHAFLDLSPQGPNLAKLRNLTRETLGRVCKLGSGLYIFWDEQT
jgi:predicted component of type VI protein secretion system